ncbi:MAG: leucine-rich repeat protein [Clostridium sp.]|jgi:hypothetical protein|nr:leucine-rich repeat protein [Clostridium sp.]
MKKTTALLLAVIFLLGIFAPAVFAAPEYGVVGAKTSGVFTYTLINSGKEVRIDYSANAKGALTIPAKIAGKPVTQIGAGAFYTRQITSVTIPSGVKSIGAHAFDFCTSLKTLTLPATLTSIGTWAFAFCSVLGSVTIPSKVSSVGDFAFAYCEGMTKVTIPSSVTKIPASCFEGCSKLNNVSLPSSVKTIGSLAFAGCSALSKLSLTSQITTIASNAFSQCGKLKALSISATIGVGQKYTLPDYKAVASSAWKGGNTTLLKKTSGVTYQGLKAGSTSYYVTDSAGRKLTVSVTVKAAPTKVVLNKAMTLGVGEAVATSITLTPSGALGTRTYSSSNTSVATVDKNGKVTAKAVGTASITVKMWNGKSSAIKVTVKKAPTKVTLSKSTATITKGKTLTLTRSYPSGTAAYTACSWSSSDTSVATVSGGKITAKKKGSCYITVKTYNGKTAKCKITVK